MVQYVVDCQWQLKFTKQVQKDAKKLAAAGLKPKAQQLLEILRQNPFTSPLLTFVSLLLDFDEG